MIGYQSTFRGFTLTVVQVERTKFSYRLHDEVQGRINSAGAGLESLDDAKDRVLEKAIRGHIFRDDPQPMELIRPDEALEWVEVNLDRRVFGVLVE